MAKTTTSDAPQRAARASSAGGYSLVIVESPAKATTIEKFLGPGYKVAASFGHVRDLPMNASQMPKEFQKEKWAKYGVDIHNGFRPYYIVSAEKERHVAALRKLLKGAGELLLATDEDREGESISWHLVEELKPTIPVRRITFNEITKRAIQDALANPREVDQRLVSAQEGRRILDRLFGYDLSELLWRKVTRNLSAGRVQSVALRMVVEREEERMRFRKAAYWDATAQIASAHGEFEARLVEVSGQRLATGQDFDPETGRLKQEAGAAAGPLHLDEAGAQGLVGELQGALPWTVSAVEQKEETRSPYPPFTTSTLQQAASSMLGFALSRTMRIAQRLYEGVDLGGGERVGLITYMRTDSVTLSEQALAEAGSVIRSEHGDQYHRRVQYTTKSKQAQEAHEAIRPTSLTRTPREAREYLDKDEAALYDLIYRRTLASQMAPARVQRTSLDLSAGRARFRATGTVVLFPGFLKVMPRDKDEAQLPAVKVGDKVHAAGVRAEGQESALVLAGLEANGHETSPPNRFTEAALVKRLEERGIGRPSTYASIVGTIQERGYVGRRGNTLVPTFLGIAVTHLLRKHFNELVDYDFTSRMEETLDDIAAGTADAERFLREFYFGGGQYGSGLVNQVEHERDKIEYPALPLTRRESGDAPCEPPIYVRIGREGQPFLSRGEGGQGNTGPIPEELDPDQLTYEKAEELIAQRQLGNEPLGYSPEGEPVYLLTGRFGPYVQLGENGETNEKPRRQSLPGGVTPADVDLRLALDLLSLPRIVGQHPESGEDIEVNLGRYGPYLRHEKDYRNVADWRQLLTMTLEEAVAVLAQPKVWGRKGAAPRVATPPLREFEVTNAAGENVKIRVLSGRYGPYATDGTTNATIPKTVKPEEITPEQALLLIEERAAAGPAKKRGAAKKKAAPKAKAGAKKAPARKKKDAGTE